MAKQPTGATVWWIGKDFRVRSTHISAARIYSGRTYESEAMNLIPSYLGGFVIVLDGDDPAGSQKRIDALHEEAAKLEAEAR